MSLVEQMDEESECPETIYKEVIEKKRNIVFLRFMKEMMT